MYKRKNTIIALVLVGILLIFLLYTKDRSSSDQNNTNAVLSPKSREFKAKINSDHNAINGSRTERKIERIDSKLEEHYSSDIHFDENAPEYSPDETYIYSQEEFGQNESNTYEIDESPDHGVEIDPESFDWGSSQDYRYEE